MTQLWLWLAFKLMPKPRIFLPIADRTSIAPQSDRSNHKKIHISKTTGLILTKFSHKLGDTQEQILWTGQLSILSGSWDIRQIVSKSAPTCGQIGHWIKHKKIHISNTTGPISTNFPHKLEDTQEQILWAGQPSILSGSWDITPFVSQSELIT